MLDAALDPGYELALDAGATDHNPFGRVPWTPTAPVAKTSDDARCRSLHALMHLRSQPHERVAYLVLLRPWHAWPASSSHFNLFPANGP